MHYLPIISPVNGTVSYITNEKIVIKIGTPVTNNILSPFFGEITEIVSCDDDNKQNKISITIKNSDVGGGITFLVGILKDLATLQRGSEPLDEAKININKILGENISYGEIIGNFVLGDSAEINLESIAHVKVVEVGTKLIAGETIVAYIASKIGIAYQINADKQLVILTVPHFKCEPKIEKNKPHNCDYYADKLASKLYETLLDETHEVIVYGGTINRSLLDLNRAESFESNFRRRIRNRIKMKINEIKLLPSPKNFSNIIYVIDCHSFPKGHFNNIRITDPDVCILFSSCNQLVLVEELTDTFRDYGIVTTKFIGNRNDIINEYYEIDQKHDIKKNRIKIVPILVEINETVSDEKITTICAAIKEWIITINKYTTKIFK